MWSVYCINSVECLWSEPPFILATILFKGSPHHTRNGNATFLLNEMEMTSSSSTAAPKQRLYEVEEVKFEGGSANASSFQRPPITAFQKGKEGWKTVDDVLPAFVWYDFLHHSVRPVNVSFRPYLYNKLPFGRRRTPTEFQLIGSNDDECSVRSQWVVLCEGRSEMAIESFDEVKGCQVDDRHIGENYRCLGLKVLALYGKNRTEITKVKINSALRLVRMWRMAE